MVNGPEGIREPIAPSTCNASSRQTYPSQKAHVNCREVPEPFTIYHLPFTDPIHQSPPQRSTGTLLAQKSLNVQWPVDNRVDW